MELYSQPTLAGYELGAGAGPYATRFLVASLTLAGFR